MMPNTSKLKNRKNALDLLLIYFKDINEWPEKWQIDEEDIAIGEAILEQYKLYLINKIEQGRAKKTIKTHGNYLWALGGELIREINNDSTQRKLLGRDLILKHIDHLGGLYWRHAESEADEEQYNSVCRQLFKFMTNSR